MIRALHLQALAVVHQAWSGVRGRLPDLPRTRQDAALTKQSRLIPIGPIP